MASTVKKSIYSLAVLELAACGVAFIGFCTLRRSEKSRKYLYQHFPTVSKTYYWAEDSISFGQLTGSRLRVSDLQRWTKSDVTDCALETD
ncbi:unnamed protein product [Haemonchus placei]|uniref:Uncharacterized protein n=1 Tax=Haemonchus placei TaxID=6290 RepID=A0A3P7TL29_HAEPC|nr:unnamed protein product [Haemonchus placei]